MNFLMTFIGVILFIDISLILGPTDDIYIGTLLYSIIYLFIYIKLKKSFKLGIIFYILYFTWVIVRPLLLLYVISNIGSH